MEFDVSFSLVLYYVVMNFVFAHSIISQLFFYVFSLRKLHQFGLYRWAEPSRESVRLSSLSRASSCGRLGWEHSRSTGL